MASVRYGSQCSPDHVSGFARLESRMALTSHRDLAPAAKEAGVLGFLEAMQLQALV